MLHAETPQQRLHDVVLNIRSFDQLARQVWGGDAATTVQIDGVLVRITHVHGAQLQREIATVVKRERALAKTLLAYNALAQDALQSLRTNLTLLQQVAAKLKR